MSESNNNLFSKDAREYAKEFLNNANNISIFSERIHKESDSRPRPQYERDYTRILYSSSFRRLQGKMQLLGIENDKFYRNRLTHSLEVSQIAKDIAKRLEYTIDDIYLVEACSLAHDLGNPPFGHCGERILDTLCDHIGGFEGNAQTFKILNNIEKKSSEYKGLNLTNRTLLGITKYFNPKYELKESRAPKELKDYKSTTNKNTNLIVKNEKFLYNEDFIYIKKISDKHNINVRTLDVQIMDIADEIAYAAHDLEDALSLNLFNVDELLHEFKDDEDFDSAKDLLMDIIKQAREKAAKSKSYYSSEEYSFIFRKEMSSLIVNKLINDIDIIDISNKFKVETGTKNNKELGFKTLGVLSKGLKKITFRCINRTDIIQFYEKQGEKVIKGLFEVYTDKKYNKDCCLLPVEFRPGKDCNDPTERLIIDYISGMMDSYAIAKYKQFFGKDSLSQGYESRYFKNWITKN